MAFHQYADDTQLYCGISTGKFESDIKVLEECSTIVEQWFLHNGMLLNADKSDVVVLSTAQQARKLPEDPVVNVAGFNIKPSSSTRSLGVVIDDRLPFDKHINAVCQSCYFHMRAFRHVRRCLTRDVAVSVARSSVLSKLDYCNALLGESVA